MLYDDEYQYKVEFCVRKKNTYPVLPDNIQFAEMSKQVSFVDTTHKNENERKYIYKMIWDEDAFKCLSMLNCKTLSDLTAYSKAEIMKITDALELTVNKIERAMKYYGYRFKENKVGVEK